MRKTVTMLVSSLLLLGLPMLNGVVAARAATRLGQAKKVITKTYAGTTEQADRWGTVSVNLKVQTTTVTVDNKKRVTRRYLDLDGGFTYHTDRSHFIMSQSLPQLRQEVLSAQTGNVQTISGATYTSEAFLQSLQSAILKATA
jgi:uncharacterized protein with FMN-binding domain